MARRALLARGITQRYPPEQARIVAIDYRRNLTGALGEDHLIGYGASADLAAELVQQVARAVEARMPPEEVTPATA